MSKKSSKKSTQNDTQKKLGRPEIWTQEILEKLGEDLLVWIREEGNYLFEKFLLDNDITYNQALSEFCAKSSAFSESVKKAKEIQKQKIIDGAMTGQFKETMSIFLLKCNHGLRENGNEDKEREYREKAEILDSVLGKIANIPPSLLKKDEDPSF